MSMQWTSRERILRDGATSPVAIINTGDFVAELEIPDPPVRAKQNFEQGPITTARWVVDDLLAIHTRNAT